MARDLTGTIATEVQAQMLRPVFLFEGFFASGVVRAWTGVGDLIWDAKTWQGLGIFAGVSPIQETSEVRADGIQVTLSGIDSTMLALALGECRQGKAGTIYLAFMDAAGAVLADPYQAFKGKLDVPSIDDDGTNATIGITYENQLIDLERPRERRYTDRDQQIDFANDKGFSFVAGLQDKSVFWGRKQEK